jgi:hypothetical protein
MCYWELVCPGMTETRTETAVARTRLKRETASSGPGGRKGGVIFFDFALNLVAISDDPLTSR